MSYALSVCNYAFLLKPSSVDMGLGFKKKKEIKSRGKNTIPTAPLIVKTNQPTKLRNKNMYKEAWMYPCSSL